MSHDWEVWSHGLGTGILIQWLAREIGAWWRYSGANAGAVTQETMAEAITKEIYQLWVDGVGAFHPVPIKTVILKHLRAK
jgi:hypothetical protein